ncbi:helix-turn-helix transcriptional regulator [Streptomyces sp. NPDC087512]|uniref:helix-turn-helix domain-containing protein n=1 Tax=Streptomyces sp. NPDC087512 TaxID=3155059 RepID=UPI003415E03D
MAGDDFAGLLRELKERSGLSYGALGKRLHMSASTLHRYVSGEVVPVEFAPVERLARVCRATPEELLELHRRWIRADALRGVKKAESAVAGEAAGAEAAEAAGTPAGGQGGTGTSGSPAAEGVAATKGSSATDAASTAQDPPAAEAVPAAENAAATDSASAAGDSSATEDSPATAVASAADASRAARAPEGPSPAPVPSFTLDAPSAPDRPAVPRRRRHRTALFAATGVVVIAGAVALVANLVPGTGDDGRRGPAGAAGATVSPGAPVTGTATGPASPSASASASPSASASASVTASAPASASASATGGDEAAPGRRRAPADGPALTVSTTPYFWDSPCDHAFLVDRSPKNVLPPPAQQDAVGWATAYGAVSANRQTVVLTVQGTGEETVVLKDLHVRVVSSKPRLDWDQYVMGNGCGGEVNTASFDVPLDLGNPLAMPVSGQRDFPYSVTESDPEVFYVKAHTSGHDVSWYLELEWSSGDRHGTTRVDDHGKPFRTSASKDASYYAYPLGSTAWEWVEGT